MKKNTENIEENKKNYILYLAYRYWISNEEAEKIYNYLRRGL